MVHSCIKPKVLGGAGGSCLLQTPGFAHKTVTDNEMLEKSG
jgi:hypothetical protein